MIVYYGSIQKFDHFNTERVNPSLTNDLDTIGFWLTSDIQSAQSFAVGTESIFEKSETEFWEDGEPKVVQIDRPVKGYVYKVYMDDPKLKKYEGKNGKSSYDLFMEERDVFYEYMGARKNRHTWRDQAILLNKEEANFKFRKNLIKQGYDGFVIQNAKRNVDLYCIFFDDSLHIADVWPLRELEQSDDN